MNLFAEAFAWLTSEELANSSLPLGEAFGQHLYFSFVTVLIAALIAVPAGYLIGHTGKGREIAVGITGAARALPSFGLILLLVLVLGVTRSELGAFIAFVLLAIPSILAGAYAGVEAVDRRTVDAARAVGMTEWQILVKVEAPLGLPLLVGGLRSAVLQVVATVTLAGYVNLGGLGYYIIQGVPLGRFDQILGGAVLVIALALVLDGLFGLLARVVEPQGLASRTQRRRADPATAETTASA